MYLSFNRSRDGINAPVSSVVVVEMNFPKPDSGVSLNCGVKKAMMYCYGNRSIANIVGAPSDEHCFIVHAKITPAQINQEKNTIKYYFILQISRILLKHWL